MSVTAPSLAPSATRRRRTSRNASSPAALRKVVEAPTLEHGLVARGFSSRDLKRVQDSMRTHFDEGVAQPLLLEIDCDTCSEDTLVETD